MVKFKFNSDGLMPAVIQDYKTGEVLMVAYMDKKSIARTLKIKKTCFWSRSRKTYWIKGESSGNTQEIKSIATDCDRDTLVIKVKQNGGACHLGYRTCFVFNLDPKGNMKKVTAKKLFDPKKVYKK